MVATCNRFTIRAVFFVVLFFTTALLSAQNVQQYYQEFDSQYGLDGRIYKGAKYNSEHQQDFGFPFLFQQNKIIGKVFANNYILDSVELQYDIYKQVLVYHYVDMIKSKQQIVLNTAEIQKFYLGSYCFIPNTNSEINATYLQVLADDSIKGYLAYRKDYKYVSNNSKKGFGYTDEMRKMYMNLGSQFFILTNTKSLLKKLPESMQVSVKEYIDLHDINFKKSNSQQLTDLFKFINTLPQ